MDPSSVSPIFILGILPRCGTNYLANLLVLHPDCSTPVTLWEDYSVAHSDLLAAFSNQVTGHWDENWGVTPETGIAFDHALGTAINQHLSSGVETPRVILKTPSVENMDQFRRFHPHAPLLILVRDGRSIIESGIRSFGWRREAALHWLAREAETIARFLDRNKTGNQGFRLVRYEDLWSQPTATMRELLAFLKLDPQPYDLEAAAELPVRGSSEITENTALHWEPIDKPKEFDPLSRHQHWTGFMHYRYQRVTGSAMEKLGYPQPVSPTNPLWKLQSLILDLIWIPRHALGSWRRKRRRARTG